MNIIYDRIFDHLEKISDHRGLFEHAEGTAHREEHGYCTDDNARLMVVSSHEADTGSAYQLSRLSLEFVLSSQTADGRCRNRMDATGQWTDTASTEDCWGRSLWGLGHVAAHHTDPVIRLQALRGFESGARQRSQYSRSMTFAALGAAEILHSNPSHNGAQALLFDAVKVIGPISSSAWPWPEPRLAYANAALAEAMIAAGATLQNPVHLDQGLTMLAWLLELETRSEHLSVTGTGGRGPGHLGPQFDQQPIEVAAMADACWRALNVTGDDRWSRGIAMAADWFTGANDVGLVMFDPESYGGYDGLHEDRVNLNQGAESTLAFVSTMQRARSLALVA